MSGAQFQFNKANIGDICGTTFDAFGNIVILHRGNHKWDQSTFGLMGDTYKKDKNSPITADTVVTVNATGHVVSSWGKDFFFLPHMITVCFIFCWFFANLQVILFETDCTIFYTNLHKLFVSS